MNYSRFKPKSGRPTSATGALTQPQPLTLGEIQRQALDADTLLLEYSLGAERSFLWAVTPTSATSYELPKREAIEAAARRVYELLSDTSGVRGQAARPRDVRLKESGGQYLAAAASLTRTLLGPVAGQLGRKRLVIVADGMLHYIPFGALPIEQARRDRQAGSRFRRARGCESAIGFDDSGVAARVGRAQTGGEDVGRAG